MTGRYKAYSEYKDSGIEWLKDMPSHWELIRAKHLFQRVQRPVRPQDGIVTAFRDGEVTLRSNRRTDGFTNAAKEIGYQGVRKGDLLVHAMDGFAGAIGISDSDGKCSPVCSVCIPRKSHTVDPTYFGYLVRQLAVTDYITSLAKGIRERSTEFRFAEFASLFLAAPPKEEQQKIASFLDHETAKIDTLIAKQEKLIELLKEKRQAVISHAVTKGLNPNAPMKGSGVEWLGEVPEHWVIKSYRYACKIYRGKFGHRPRNDPAFYDGEYPFIQTGDVARAGKYIKDYKQTLNEKGIGVSQKFPVGTLMMAIAANIGDTAILGFEAYAPDSVVGFKPKADIDLEFLRYSFMAAFPALEQTSTQSTQANLNVDRIGAVQASFPSISEQREIVAYLDTLLEQYDDIESKSQKSIELMKERKTALISAAVTGKIDVRDWEPK
ncbi:MULTISPECIES: restriction endonuclease subunit S [Vibrio]|uniref:restriction endonuclease subunit S n=1 Tax=Vibrio TaxID=662 RepID=UPI0009F09416|nr:MULTISPECIES: restriction endonuclease subunit S [Vibrio]EGR2797229.1 restriction endonuclease subunit S [Vibrio navarrensis]EJG0619928.1 restriction endonuclease subunit S [Vibrio parahaemolyticus]EJG0622884.1 restriction endonuclease subunit S [Vibrio parahaemolyticus]EJG0638126.1 restriction endonuclease subunit S [Vibrio parahaemolyticus]EJG0685339.1 restriction endonuclease subunit S [Vibrio parahaemolyticus]